MQLSIDPTTGLKEYRSDRGDLLSIRDATRDEVLLWIALNAVKETKSIERTFA